MVATTCYYIPVHQKMGTWGTALYYYKPEWTSPLQHPIKSPPTMNTHTGNTLKLIFHSDEAEPMLLQSKTPPNGNNSDCAE